MTSSLFPHVQFVATWMSLRAKYVQPSCLVISAQGCRSFAVDASYLCCFCFFVWSLISHKDEKLQNKNQQLIVEVNKSAFLAVGSIIFYILIFFFFFILQSAESQVKMFGKCCQLRPTGGSSSSLDSSSSCTSETKESKEQGLRFPVTQDWDCLNEVLFYKDISINTQM